MVNKNKKLVHGIYYLILTIVFLVTVFPLFYILMASFKTNSDILAYPAKLITDNMSFDNYIRAWNSPQFQVKYLIGNSLYYSLGSVCIAIFISSMAGYVFSRGNFPGKKIVFGCFTSLMFIQLGGIGIYATFEVLNFVHLPQSLPTLLLIGLFGVPTVNMYLVKGYVDTHRVSCSGIFAHSTQIKSHTGAIKDIRGQKRNNNRRICQKAEG